VKRRAPLHGARQALWPQHQNPARRRLDCVIRIAQLVQRGHNRHRVLRHALARIAEVEVVVGPTAKAQQRLVRRDEVVERLLNLSRLHLGRATQLARRRDQAAPLLALPAHHSS
jgi:hypothetical protein